MMDRVDTEADVGVLIPDRITVFLDHDVSHPDCGPMGQSARRESVLEQRTCRQKDHAWVRWDLDKCQSMPQIRGMIESEGGTVGDVGGCLPFLARFFRSPLALTSFGMF